MRRFQEWVLTLGLAAATPSVALAGPLDLFDGGPKPGQHHEAAAGVKVSNQDVANHVKSALQNSNLGGHEIHVEYKNGVARLKGSVQTPEQRDMAVAAARRVPHVRKVECDLNVASARKVHRGGIQQVQFAQQMAQETDQGNQQMAEQIAGALRAAQFRGKGVQIRFQGGVVTLIGEVADPQTKALADQTVMQIPGVQGFDNQLVVAGEGAPQEVMAPPAGPIGPPQFGAQPMGAPPMGAPQFGPPVGPADATYPGAAPNNLQEVAFQGQVPVQQGPPPAGPQGGYPAEMMPQGAPVAGASHQVYDQPNLPNHAYPTYGSYPNYAQVSYPQQYSASAWPYIGPFYPYPQVPLGWRKVQLEWDDGYWQLNFRPRTEKWWWFMNPNNW